MKLSFDQRTPGFRAISAVCVLLVCLTGFITAVHIHPARANAPDRSCSVCAMAHAGVVPVELTSPAPALSSSGTLEESAESAPSFALHSALYIRPPPLV
jgi:hypothetical protein